MTVRRILPFVAIAVVVGGLLWAFITVGTPARARLDALDRIRMSNLYEIALAMHDRLGTGNGLPATLPSDLKPGEFGTVGTRGNFTGDPESRAPYEYLRIDRNTYRLCATFALAYLPMRPSDRSWKHPSGRACFEFDVRKIPTQANFSEDASIGDGPPF